MSFFSTSLYCEITKSPYQANKDKDWGVIAKNLGIKPGSKEFHAFKNGYPGIGAGGKGNGKG